MQLIFIISTAATLFRTEYGAFWKCVQVGGMYLLVQLCKMMLLATFFPTLDSPTEAAGLFTVSVCHYWYLAISDTNKASVFYFQHM